MPTSYLENVAIVILKTKHQTAPNEKQVGYNGHWWLFVKHQNIIHILSIVSKSMKDRQYNGQMKKSKGLYTGVYVCVYLE